MQNENNKDICILSKNTLARDGLLVSGGEEWMATACDKWGNAYNNTLLQMTTRWPVTINRYANCTRNTCGRSGLCPRDPQGKWDL